MESPSSTRSNDGEVTAMRSPTSEAASAPHHQVYEIDCMIVSNNGVGKSKRSLWSRLFKSSKAKSRRTVATMCSRSSRFLYTDDEGDDDNESTLSEATGFPQEGDDDYDESRSYVPLPSQVVPSNRQEEDDDKTSSPSSCPLPQGDDNDDEVSERMSVDAREDMLQRANEARDAGEYFRSLVLYERVLKCQEDDPVTSANLCFACIKLCGLLQDYHRALEFAELELQHTLKIAAGTPSLAVARCYHELARISKYGLGEPVVALAHYQTALSIELACLRRGGNVREAEHCLRETKECIGRTQFELGNLDDALRML